MNSKYYYPQVATGYRWNMLQRIFNAINLDVVESGDIFDASGLAQTYIGFTRPLTDAEKTQVDAIMADNPGFPPAEPTNTVYQIKDIWETRQEFSTKVGNLQFYIYYNESVPGSGVFDRVELHFKKPLGASEKNKVVDEQSKLMSLKSN